MIIAGLQKLSLVDYPGYLASAVFVQGCNFRCGYCQNPDLITRKKQFDISEKEILTFLKGKTSKIEGVVITGGEPTIYRDLPEFIKKIKELGFKVKLDSNSSNPDLIKKMLKENLLDYISLDVKTSLDKYHLVTSEKDIEKKISECIKTVSSSQVPYELRTTCVPGIVDKEDFEKIGKAVKGTEKYCLQQFRPAVTFNEEFQNIKPYTKNAMEEFRKILGKYVKKVEIRGL